MKKIKTMNVIIIIIYFSLSLANSDDVFVIKEDFCKIMCVETSSDYKGLSENEACYCPIFPDRTLLTNDIVTFREGLLKVFNTLRNEVAGGVKASKKAANMMVMNYDIRLEYVAKCLLGKLSDVNVERFHQACLNTPNVEKNYYLEFSAPPDFDLTNSKAVVKFVKMEINKIIGTRISSSFEEKRLVDNCDYNAIVYWSHCSLGCARLDWNSPVKPKFKKYILCIVGADFMGLNYDTRSYYRRDHDKLLYHKGEPCTRCPFQVNCLKKPYPNLCGELQPVPTQEKIINKGEADKNNFIKIVTLVVFLFVF